MFHAQIFGRSAIVAPSFEGYMGWEKGIRRSVRKWATLLRNCGLKYSNHGLWVGPLDCVEQVRSALPRMKKRLELLRAKFVVADPCGSDVQTRALAAITAAIEGSPRQVEDYSFHHAGMKIKRI